MKVNKLSLLRILNEENKYFVEMMKVEDWFHEELKKLRSIENPKFRSFKEKSLFNIYQDKLGDIVNRADMVGIDPSAIKGDINARFLYHYTTGKGLLGILVKNKILGSQDEGISFTTNSNLYARKFGFSPLNTYETAGVKIKLDFNKMKDSGLEFKESGLGTTEGEEEVNYPDTELDNILDYVIEVIVQKNKTENYQQLSKLLSSKNIRHKIV